MSKKLTPWFIDGSIPARPGVYNVSCRKEQQSGDWYARWDGKSWSYASRDKEAAGRETRKPTFPLHWSMGSWRGLAKKPAQKAAV